MNLVCSPLGGLTDFHKFINFEEPHYLGLANLNLLTAVIDQLFRCSHHDVAALKIALLELASECLVDDDCVSDVVNLFEGDTDIANCQLNHALVLSIVFQY